MIVKDSINVYMLRRMLSFYEDDDVVELISTNLGDSTLSHLKISSKDKGWNREVLYTNMPHKSEG